jgi:hypothetical protein
LVTTYLDSIACNVVDFEGVAWALTTEDAEGLKIRLKLVNLRLKFLST